ncbi:hypothetical protein ACFLRQ_03520 [Bacteroidota bacterium]
MEQEFENNLINRGFTFQKHQNGYYEVYNLHRVQPGVRVQLIPSKPIDIKYHGSQNGSGEIHGIGVFHINIEDSLFDPEVIVFSFHNINTTYIEYMIIPTEELRKRLKKNLVSYRTGEHLELKLWLMDDHLYDTTHFGIEAEWYYLSKGVGGRMIDTTDWNYTKFLNNWDFGFGSREQV